VGQSLIDFFGYRTESSFYRFDTAWKTGWNIFDSMLWADEQGQDIEIKILIISRYVYPKLIDLRFSVQGSKVTTNGWYSQDESKFEMPAVPSRV
jgi:hypothetical protein